jgi:hypothetical protein
MCSIKSRWLGPKRRTESSTPRYSPNEAKTIGSRYSERTGWYRGARVGIKPDAKDYSTFDYEQKVA